MARTLHVDLKKDLEFGLLIKMTQLDILYCTIFSSPDSPEAEDEKKHVDGEEKYEESQKQDLQCRSCFKIFFYLKILTRRSLFLGGSNFWKTFSGKTKKYEHAVYFFIFYVFFKPKITVCLNLSFHIFMY